MSACYVHSCQWTSIAAWSHKRLGRYHLLEHAIHPGRQAVSPTEGRRLIPGRGWGGGRLRMYRNAIRFELEQGKQHVGGVAKAQTDRRLTGMSPNVRTAWTAWTAWTTCISCSYCSENSGT